jgi:hypothetical protein
MIPSKYETIFQQITENSFLELFFKMELGWSKYVGSVASRGPLKKKPYLTISWQQIFCQVGLKSG